MNKRFAAAMALCLSAGMVFSGCGEKKTASEGSEITYPSDGSVYPMQCADSLSVYTAYDTDTEKIKYWQEKTGVTLDFSSSISGTGSEALSLMIASDDLPDILLTDLSTQPGGVQKYADDGVIIDLTDSIKEYAPNFKKLLDENDEVRKLSTSDDGKNYFFPTIRDGNKLRSYRGPVIRKDLLEKYNIDIPETIDDWHNMLTVFKNNGIQYPLCYQVDNYELYGGIFGAYGVVADFYRDNGKVKYGYLEDGMREGLKTLAKWYSEGLLDQNIVNASSNMDNNMVSGKSAATFTTSGGGMGKYLRAGKQQTEGYDLVGVPLPVLNKGDKAKFSTSVWPVSYNNNGFVTSKCTNIELATRFLDFGYSEEGHMQMNFGKEGVSYEMKDGYPTYTDLIMNNPDGLSVGDAMTEWIFANWSGPFAQDERYIEQYNQYDQQKAALTSWGERLEMSSSMPPVSLTTEESNRISVIMNNVKTCADENLYKFIMGIKSVDTDYDSFISELKGFGIDEAIEIYTTALECYNKR